MMLELVSLPFLMCLLIGVILGYLGIHVLKREVIFIDIAVAAVAAVGSIGAHLAFDAEEDSVLSYLFSLVCVLLISGFYAVSRKKVIQISIEAVIGISYAVTTAGAMFLIGVSHGHEHAEEMLAGKLLWVTWRHILSCSACFSAVGICLYIFRRPLSKISGDYRQAAAEGMNVTMWDFVFYSLLGVVITFAVRVTGVVTVFAFLIIPATTSALFASGWGSRMFIAWFVAASASACGLLFSYYFDFSMGPAVALFLGVVLAVSALLVKLLPVQQKQED